MSEKKISSNIQLEMIMANKAISEALPGVIERAQLNAQILFSKYNRLIEVGFTEEQAMKIICERDLIE